MLQTRPAAVRNASHTAIDRSDPVCQSTHAALMGGEVFGAIR